METLKEIKEKFGQIAGAWNGDDSNGEFQAMDAKEIVEYVEELESKIKAYEADYE